MPDMPKEEKKDSEDFKFSFKSASPGMIYPGGEAGAPKPKPETLPKVTPERPLIKQGRKAQGQRPKSGLRTFKSDVQKYFKEGKESMVGLAIKAAKRKAERPQGARSFLGKLPLSIDRVFLARIGLFVVLLLLLGSAVWFLRGYFGAEEASPFPRPPASFFSAPAREVISIPRVSREDFIKEFGKASFKVLPPGNIVDIAVFNESTNSYITSKGFFDLAEISAPPALLASLKDKWTLGAGRVKVGENEFFLIFSVDSFERAFSAMLEWERSLPGAMRAFGPRSRSLDRGINTFKDEVILNNDVRVLYNGEGESIFAYSFFDKRILIITFSKDVLADLLERFLVSPPNVL